MGRAEVRGRGRGLSGGGLTAQPEGEGVDEGVAVGVVAAVEALSRGGGGQQQQAAIGRQAVGGQRRAAVQEPQHRSPAHRDTQVGQ